MIRTQVHLTQKQKEALKTLPRERGKKRSELIREAIDWLLEKQVVIGRQEVLSRLAGMWRNRTDLPDFDELRKEWDRGPSA